jgi:hypothetical protein
MNIVNQHFVRVCLLFLFLFPALADLINGYLNVTLESDFSLGILYRGSLMLFAIPCIFFSCRKDILIFLLFAFGWFLCSNIYWSQLEYYSFVRELQQIARIFFPYFMLSILIVLFNNNKLNLSDVFLLIVLNGLFCSCAIIFSSFLGFGYDTYKGVFGSISFFKAQNDISLVILLSNVINFYLYISKKSTKYLLFFCINILALLLIGTRSGILGSMLIIIFFLFSIATFSRKEIKRNLLRRGTIILFSFSVFIIAVYKVYIHVFLKNKYLLDKMLVLFSKSPRHKLTSIAHEEIYKRGFFSNFFGEGYLSFAKKISFKYHHTTSYSEVGKLVEQDFYDLIGAYGFILGIIFLAIPIMLLLKSFINLIYKRTLLNFTIVLMMLIFIIHAFLAGHAINSPTVGTIIIIAYYQTLYHKKFYAHN